MKTFEFYNQELLNKLSNYLTFHEKDIKEQDITEMLKYCKDKEQAYKLLLLAMLNIEDKDFEREYFNDLVHLQNAQNYLSNPYFTNIKFPVLKSGEWELKFSNYEKYELFVVDDFLYKGLKVIPQLGFFDTEFGFPAVYQNDVLWMSITPNEINTMKEPIDKAYGKVLTFGLGLGYFAYMCSIKENVQEVVVVERDKKIIEMFKTHILPQIPNSKITVLNSDAYEFLESQEKLDYDYIFVDIYHDAGDGQVIYKKFEKYSNKAKNKKFDYWIEKTIKYYL